MVAQPYERDIATKNVPTTIITTRNRRETIKDANEGRKIDIAKRHFSTLGLDYRHIDDKVPNWWRPEVNSGQQKADM